jgi:hypothetical protein
MRATRKFRAAPDDSYMAPRTGLVVDVPIARSMLVGAGMALWRAMDTDDLDVLLEALIDFDRAAVAYARAVCADELNPGVIA